MFFAGSAVKYFTSDLIHEIHPMPPYGKIESNFFYKFLSEVNQNWIDEIFTPAKKMIDV